MAETFADLEQDNQCNIQTSADPEPDKQLNVQTSAGHLGRFCDLFSMNRHRSGTRVVCENPTPAPRRRFLARVLARVLEVFLRVFFNDLECFC
jgi:hypothetical protein